MKRKNRFTLLLSIAFALALVFDPGAFARTEDEGGGGSEDCEITSEVIGNTIVSYNMKVSFFGNGCKKKCGATCSLTLPD